MNKKRWVVVVGIVVAVLAGGFYPWPVTGLVRGLIARQTASTGWTVSIQSACWVPLKAVTLDRLQIESPQGWKLRALRVEIRPVLSVMRGGLKTYWKSGAMELDLGSLKVPNLPESAPVSPGILSLRGLATVWVYPNRVDLLELFLSGTVARVVVFGQAVGRPDGWIRAHGAITRPLLETMRWLPAAEITISNWEPFEFQMTGDWRRPDCSFVSGFLNFSLQRRGSIKGE
jgi:hypothetical protein